MKPSRLIAERLLEIERQESKLPEREAVHDMRIAARRLRAALRLARLRDLDAAVKALQDALGEVRDLQLQAKWFRGRDAALARAREARLRKAESALPAALQRWRTQTLPRIEEAAAQARPIHARRAGKVVRKRFRRLEERLESARTRPTPQSMHRARISVKQVRYLLEVGRPQLPAGSARLVAELKPLQASLGQLHDVDVRLALVKRRPLLLRGQREARDRLAKIVAAQLSRWHKQKVVARALKRLGQAPAK